MAFAALIRGGVLARQGRLTKPYRYYCRRGALVKYVIRTKLPMNAGGIQNERPHRIAGDTTRELQVVAMRRVDGAEAISTKMIDDCGFTSPLPASSCRSLSPPNVQIRNWVRAQCGACRTSSLPPPMRPCSLCFCDWRHGCAFRYMPSNAKPLVLMTPEGFSHWCQT